MDFVKKAMSGGDENKGGNNQSGEQSSDGGGGIMDKFNSAAGGGKDGEKNEDYLDKGVDMVQQYGMGAGKQDNESAVEQAKDEQISDAIRRQYKSNTGSDIPIEDKKTTFG
ncbi:hypothetical protein MMC21_007484 [Puttea exsequens]|nr:hypothetical protein [Puttea exsequens]